MLPLAAAGLWLAGWQSLPEAPPAGPAALGQALLVALFACFGFEQSAVVAGEMRDPKRDLPVGILGGVAISGALYALVMLACFATVPGLATSSRPLADAAAALTGSVGATVIVAAAVVSCAGGLAGAMLVAPRIFYALRLSGDLPRSLAIVNPQRGTAPVPIPGGNAIALLALACCAGVVANSSLAAVRDVAIALATGLALRAAVHR